MAGDWGEFLTPSNVADFVRGIDFPCSKQELIEQAEDNNAPPQVIDQLEKLPNRHFESLTDLLKTVGGAVL